MHKLTQIALGAGVAILAIVFGFYQIYIQPVLFAFGKRPLRIPQSIGSAKCKSVPELQACAKIVLHQPTGLLYLACSTPEARTQWNPQVNILTPTEDVLMDYIATYDPSTNKITKWAHPEFNNGLGLTLFGMDVVTSSTNPKELYLYLINHRVPISGQRPETIGSDPHIEIFKMSDAGEILGHIRSVRDPKVIITPADIVGSPDGKSFYFTNDHAKRVGWTRSLDVLGAKSGSVGYCHVDSGCKLALKKVHSPYGLAGHSNGTLFVANSIFGGVTMLEAQADNSLIVGDTIKTVYPLNSISLDLNGHLWAAALPQALTHADHLFDPELQSPSAAFALTVNTGLESYYGAKYKVKRVFEDDGSVMSGVTTVAYDALRMKLFMHGTAASQLLVCTV